MTRLSYGGTLVDAEALDGEPAFERPIAVDHPLITECVLDDKHYRVGEHTF